MVKTWLGERAENHPYRPAAGKQRAGLLVLLPPAPQDTSFSEAFGRASNYIQKLTLYLSFVVTSRCLALVTLLAHC
jgi:hypothetical protein